MWTPSAVFAYLVSGPTPRSLSPESRPGNRRDPVTSLGAHGTRTYPSVGKERHGRALIPAQEDGPDDGIGAETVLHSVEGGVEERAPTAVERQDQLDGLVAGEVRQRHPHQGEASIPDHRH